MAINQIIKPDDLESALSALAANAEKASVIAGGTDLLPAMAKNLMSPTVLVDIGSLEDLKVLKEEGDDIIIGAALTHNEILESFVGEQLPAFGESMSSIACNQTRNMGTIGGNVAMAVPSADTAPALLVYDAQVVLASQKKGKRQVPLDQFFTGPRRTVMEPGEIIVSFILPGAKKRRSAFIKHGRRKALSLAVVNVAASMRLENNLCREVRIAMGAVAPTPVRAYEAEKMLEGKEPSESNIRQAAELAALQECSPIDDFRASCAYRQELVKVYVRRVLESITGSGN
ncbi:MAG: xanthine dehydrogenase family protein subunit M [Bacillota bacterium]|nr:xanthine dehydrogenase family protein subunit M [Bacillota bacterium]